MFQHFPILVENRFYVLIDFENDDSSRLVTTDAHGSY